MTPDELTIVERCARAVCAYCANPEKWEPAALDDGDLYHKPKGVTKGRLQWCDAGAIWYEFDESREPEALTDSLAGLPLFAQEAP